MNRPAMKTAEEFALFGTPSRPDYYADIEQACRLAGREWGLTHRKLPVHVKVGERDIQIARSMHEFARAFVAGFREVKA
jgi:hypothetical protein